MKKFAIVVIVLAVIAAVVYVANVRFQFISGLNHQHEAKEKALYYCPMHPQVTSDRPGDCPICNMSLVKKDTPQGPAMGHEPKQEQRQIKFYRNPMNPEITSPVPMKDEMGMDYIPVYQEPAGAHGGKGVNISAQKQQLIGVKTQKAQVRNLTGQIETVGRVAYDPDLFTAQQEYLQAIKGRQMTTGKDQLAYAASQTEEFVKISRRKLLLLGMNDAEIDAMVKTGTPEQNLYLPQAGDNTVWVYLTMYEYEAQLVEPNMPVEVETAAYPTHVFKGKIVSIAPRLEPATRSLKVRALVDNPGNMLKLEMYVNARIKFDLGRMLAVPEEAIMHTGTRNVVFVTDANGYFEPRDVQIGTKAQGYYPVLKGLEPNEIVVTSGNFLIDSESKLNAAFSQMAEPNQ